MKRPPLLLALLALPTIVLTEEYFNIPDFTTYPSFSNFPKCLQDSLQNRSSMPCGYFHWGTISCLCDAQNLYNNEPYGYEWGETICEDTKEGERATRMVDGYCELQGFTVRVPESTSMGWGGSATAVIEATTVPTTPTVSQTDVYTPIVKSTSSPPATPSTSTTFETSTLPPTTSSTPSSPPTNTATPQPTAAPEKKGPDTGTLVGAIIGSITGFIGLLALIFTILNYCFNIRVHPFGGGSTSSPNPQIRPARNSTNTPPGNTTQGSNDIAMASVRRSNPESWNVPAAAVMEFLRGHTGMGHSHRREREAEPNSEALSTRPIREVLGG